MASLFSEPKTPTEDPDAANLRKQEQQRAERDRIRATQQQLQQETSLRSNNTGVSSLRRRALTSLLGAG